MRLIHTADWQIGKVFRFVDQATMGVLQEARLDAIATIGRLAHQHGAPVVLVAGDVYDCASADDRTLGQAIERMRGCPQTAVAPDPRQSRPAPAGGAVGAHLAPRPAGQRRGPSRAGAGGARRRSRPAVAGAARPAPRARRPDRLDGSGAGSPRASIRIGLAHGSITAFGSDAHSQPNLIDPARPQRAGLAYLALGDWHGTKRIGPRCWYSGTPEIDDFGIEGGQVLLVDLPGADAPPRVEPLASGRFHWRQERVQIHAASEIEVMLQRLRGLQRDPAALLLDLALEGTLSLAGREQLGRALDELAAALRFLRVDDRQLYQSPSAEDLEAIAQGGFVRAAAERLRLMAEDVAAPEREVAARALLRLYTEHRKLAAR